jgi:hypothetical protein
MSNFNSPEDCVDTFVEFSWKCLIDRIILREDLIGVFEGPISNDSELASEQTCTEMNPDANQKERGSQSEGEGNAPTLKPDLKIGILNFEDAVDNKTAGSVCVQCYDATLYVDGNESERSNSCEDSTEEESSNEEDSPFLLSI